MKKLSIFLLSIIALSSYFESFSALSGRFSRFSPAQMGRYLGIVGGSTGQPKPTIPITSQGSWWQRYFGSAPQASIPYAKTSISKSQASTLLPPQKNIIGSSSTPSRGYRSIRLPGGAKVEIDDKKTTITTYEGETIIDSKWIDSNILGLQENLQMLNNSLYINPSIIEKIYLQVAHLKNELKNKYAVLEYVYNRINDLIEDAPWYKRLLGRPILNITFLNNVEKKMNELNRAMRLSGYVLTIIDETPEKRQSTQEEWQQKKQQWEREQNQERQQKWEEGQEDKQKQREQSTRSQQQLLSLKIKRIIRLQKDPMLSNFTKGINVTKKTYHTLMMKYHPDHYRSEGNERIVTQEDRDIANTLSKTINAVYKNHIGN